MLVGTITDDKRLYELPKLRVVALRFTETARARILKVRLVDYVNLMTKKTGSELCNLGPTAPTALAMQ